MLQTDLDNQIISLQCKHVDLTSKLVNYLSINSPKVVCTNRKSVSTAYVLGLLKRYKAFTSEVTFASKLEIVRSEEGSVQLVLTLNNHVKIYNGTGTDEEIAIYFEDEINNIALAPFYKVVRIKNILYIYSYDTGADFNDTFTVTTSDSNLVDTTITNLQNSTDEILNLWNNITYEELCCLLNFGNSQVKIEVGSNASTPCNC